MRIKGNTTSLLIAISLLLLLLVPCSARMIPNAFLYTTMVAYGQVNNMNSNLTNLIMPENIPLKKVHVGDIDIAYKMFGRGSPLLLIVGAGATMDSWDPTVMKQLSVNHTVIIFDNRGIGLTSAGTIKNFSISQYANDTASLLDALAIRKADILGHSLGSLIAQELALMHSEKVNRLILYASTCGGKNATPATPEVYSNIARLANPKLNLTSIDQARIIADVMFPQQWKEEHPNYLSYLPSSREPISPKTVQLQSQAVVDWKGTCDRLSNINKPTLVIVGTDDVFVPPANSLMLVEKIPGTWLVQIKGGGHGLMYQYPDKFSKIVLTFLET